MTHLTMGERNTHKTRQAQFCGIPRDVPAVNGFVPNGTAKALLSMAVCEEPKGAHQGGCSGCARRRSKLFRGKVRIVGRTSEPGFHITNQVGTDCSRRPVIAWQGLSLSGVCGTQLNLHVIAHLDTSKSRGTQAERSYTSLGFERAPP